MIVYKTDFYKVQRLIICGSARYLIIKIGEKGYLNAYLSKKHAIAVCNKLNKLCK